MYQIHLILMYLSSVLVGQCCILFPVMIEQKDKCSMCSTAKCILILCNANFYTIPCENIQFSYIIIELVTKKTCKEK